MRSIINNNNNNDDDDDNNNNDNNRDDNNKINLRIRVSQISKLPVKERLKSLAPMSPSTLRYFSAVKDFIANLRGFVNGCWSQDEESMRP